MLFLLIFGNITPFPGVDGNSKICKFCPQMDRAKDPAAEPDRGDTGADPSGVQHQQLLPGAGQRAAHFPAPPHWSGGSTPLYAIYIGAG